MSRPFPENADRPALAARSSSTSAGSLLRLPRLLLLVALLVLPVGLVAGPAAAQAEFPSPVVAPVLPDEATAAPLAVTSLRIDESDGSTLVVGFREPFDLPDVFRYRIALHVGDPAGENQRISLLAESGPAEGVVEEGTDGNWSPVGATEVSFDAGEARLALPDDLAVEATDLAWVEVALVPTEGGASQRFLTPLFPAPDLLAPVGPQLAAASFAWGSINKQPPDPAVASGVPPTVRVEDGEVVVTYTSALPALVGDAPVANTVDVVRVAPDFEAGGRAPYLVAIDHGKGTVSLLDGTQDFPVEVTTDGSWVTEGLPEGGIEPGGVIRFQLADVLDAFGLPPESEQAALGIARSVTLDDGQVVRADGPLGTAAWFEAAAAAPPASTPGTVTSEPGVDAPAEAPATTSSSDSSRSLVPVVAVVCVVVLLGAAAWLTLRWLEHRRHLVVTGGAPGGEPKTSVMPTPDERARLEAFTSELFGGAGIATTPASSGTDASLFVESEQTVDADAPGTSPAHATSMSALDDLLESAANVEGVAQAEAIETPAPQESPEPPAAVEEVQEAEVVEPAATEAVDPPEPAEAPAAIAPPAAEAPTEAPVEAVAETLPVDEEPPTTPAAKSAGPIRPSGNPAADLLTDLLNAEVDRLGPPAETEPPAADAENDPLPDAGLPGLPSRSRK